MNLVDLLLSSYFTLNALILAQFLVVYSTHRYLMVNAKEAFLDDMHNNRTAMVILLLIWPCLSFYILVEDEDANN